jgi:molybdopterin-binding protein
VAEQIRIGQAAAILGVSVDTLRRWEREGRVAFDRSAGGQRTIDAGQLRVLLADRAPKTGVSARNQLEGTVVAVETDGLMGRVELACGPYRVVSIITAEAVEELDLKPGDAATAVVKATNVEVRR